jgi:hypothetical protein
VTISENVRLKASFDKLFPQGLFLRGEIVSVMKHQLQEGWETQLVMWPQADKVTGLPLCREDVCGFFGKEESGKLVVEFACAHQQVPPETIVGLLFRPGSRRGAMASCISA